MADKPIPRSVPIPPNPNGNGWKRKVLGKLAENPVDFLDWAFKVGVSSAIGLYLVVSLTGAMKSYLAIQGEETIKQTRQITEMALATKEVSLSQGTIKDMSKAGEAAAKAAQEAAGIAAKGMADQKPLMESMVKSSERRTVYMGEMLTEQKRLLSAMEKMEKMEKFGSDDRKKILERLPAKPEPPRRP